MSLPNIKQWINHVVKQWICVGEKMDRMYWLQTQQ